MMHKDVRIALVLGILVGCATSQVATVSPAEAEPAEAEASATPSAFRECVNFELDSDDDLDDLSDNAKHIGSWTPVGGTSNGVVLCR